MAGEERGKRRVATLGRGAAIARALVAAAVMATGLVLSTEVSALLFGVDATAASGFGSRVLVACCVTLVVVGAVLLLRRRWDRRSLTGIGLTGLRADASGFALGLGTLVAAGVAMLLALDVTGVISLIALDPVRLLGFLGANTVVATPPRSHPGGARDPRLRAHEPPRCLPARRSDPPQHRDIPRRPGLGPHAPRGPRGSSRGGRPDPPGPSR